MFQSVQPMLRTKDLHATIKFWTERLGFTCERLSEEDGWALLCRDRVGVMVGPPNSHASLTTPSFTGSLYFNVDDAGALWRELKDDAEIAYPIEDFRYGMREFAIYDNNGYMLQFGTPLAGNLFPD